MKRVVLLGMMGSGKSSVGHALSELTGWPLHDNDVLLVRLFGLTAKELLEQRGEPPLREAEAAALLAALKEPAPCIVDAAAGTIEHPDLRAALAAEPACVWLRATWQTLYDRSRRTDRPWQDLGDEWLRAKVELRYPLFEDVADLILDTDTGDPTEAAREILDWLGRVAMSTEVPAP